MSEKLDIEKEIIGITDAKALSGIAYLLEEIRQLKEEVVRLKKHSGNSSKPPSSDIVKPKREQGQSGKRKAGGQMKHAGERRVIHNEVCATGLFLCPFACVHCA